MRLSLFTVVLLSVSAAAGPKGDKALAARAEAQDLVDAILRGEGNLNASLSRVQYLGQEGAVALDLAETVRRSGDVEQVRRIAQALATLAHPNGEVALLYLLGNEDGATRMHAAQGVGRLKSQAALPRLMAMLADKSMGVRKEVARALAQLRNPKAGAALLKAARGEGEIEARAEMLVAVGASGDKRQAPGLEAYLDDSSESSRLAAAQALCLLGNKKGFEFAKKRLQSTDHFERIEGLRLFEGSRSKDVVSVLGPLLEDKDTGVGAMTARILYQGGDEKKLDWLVLKSFQASGDAKLVYERELETLRLADDRRKAILAKAGIK